MGLYGLILISHISSSIFFVDKENVEVICSPFGNGVMKIKKIWFNDKINAFGLRVDKISDKIIKNSVIFRFL